MEIKLKILTLGKIGFVGFDILTSLPKEVFWCFILFFLVMFATVT